MLLCDKAEVKPRFPIQRSDFGDCTILNAPPPVRSALQQRTSSAVCAVAVDKVIMKPVDDQMLAFKLSDY